MALTAAVRTRPPLIKSAPVSGIRPMGVPRPKSTATSSTGPGRRKPSKSATPAGHKSRHELHPQVRSTRVGEEPLPWPVRAMLIDEAHEATDPKEFCGEVVRGAVEVLAGTRSAHQLRAWVTPQVFGQLRLRAELERDRTTPAPKPTGAVRVRKVVLNRMGDQAEATVLVDTVDRVRAAAARLALHRGVWRICVLEIA